ncbi:hypothetical protein [Homoserinibacter sp. YIM 151385]|uniref:hypothetical protein n=1 Tax=Homoserinibacter sp. YIM 151385 TaxID=2985506 RepID=UPI0022F0750E|nr:hypothetical protein [Homoserinibacter sp. YIM 151385]WBU38199.1 hypothetical protein OF852_01045 [Homoserinibacter sp. YIM 151385]
MSESVETERLTGERSELDPVETPAAEVQRIMRTGTIWMAAGALAPPIGLGPLVAAGWRPGELPLAGELVFWLGAVVAAAGLALLVWAGCPVLGFRLREAYQQKVVSIRVGVVLNLSGLTLAGLAILLSP